MKQALQRNGHGIAFAIACGLVLAIVLGGGFVTNASGAIAIVNGQTIETDSSPPIRRVQNGSW